MSQNKENQLILPDKRAKPTGNKPTERRQLRELAGNETASFNVSLSDSELEREGEQKLIQLTSQCTEYFNRFILEKDSHIGIVHRVFAEIAEKVEDAFGKIIQQAQKKLDEIRNFLAKEQRRLLEQKRSQEQVLNKLLLQIKSVHLTKLESKFYEYNKRDILGAYALTLDTFFNKMMEIERNNYEDSVEECINFINNLIRQEVKNIVEDKFPHKVEDIIGLNFSNEHCFTFQEQSIKEIDSQMANPNPRQIHPHPDQQQIIFKEIQQIKARQMERQQNISDYHRIMSTKTPFKAIKITN